MSDDQSGVVTLKVRVTPEFREKIVVTAKENNRSMNQEIVSRLEGSFSEDTEKTLMLSLINASEKHTEALQKQIAISNLIMAQLADKLPDEDPVKIKIKDILKN